MKIALRELFNFHSGSGKLTEKILYENQPVSASDKVVVLSSATEDSTHLPSCSLRYLQSTGLNVFAQANGYVLVARNGQAGYMRVVEERQFTITDHAYLLEPKKPTENLVNLKYFVIAYQDLFFDLVTSKDSNGTFSKNIAEKLIIKLPSIEIQNEVVKAYNKQQEIYGKLSSLNDEISDVKRKSISTCDERIELLKNLINIQGGTSSSVLHEKILYNNCPTSDDDKLLVYSGATDDSAHLPACSRKFAESIGINIYDRNNKYMLITYVGKAGTLKSVSGSDFIITNNANIAEIKASAKDIADIDYVSAAFQEIVYEHVTGKNGLGVIPKRVLENIEVPLPPIETQREVILKHLKLTNALHKVSALKSVCQQNMGKLVQIAVTMAMQAEMFFLCQHMSI